MQFETSILGAKAHQVSACSVCLQGSDGIDGGMVSEGAQEMPGGVSYVVCKKQISCCCEAQSASSRQCLGRTMEA